MQLSIGQQAAEAIKPYPLIPMLTDRGQKTILNFTPGPQW
jgi:hypothetical protein